MIGGVILWRVRTAGHPKPCVLVSFAVLVIFSGILCFVLEKNWFASISSGAKVTNARARKCEFVFDVHV